MSKPRIIPQAGPSWFGGDTQATAARASSAALPAQTGLDLLTSCHGLAAIAPGPRWDAGTTALGDLDLSVPPLRELREDFRESDLEEAILMYSVVEGSDADAAL